MSSIVDLAGEAALLIRSDSKARAEDDFADERLGIHGVAVILEEGAIEGEVMEDEIAPDAAK